MKKAFSYIRVSTDEQAQEGKSIEAQQRICNQWADENEYLITDEFVDEGKSGSDIKGRPAMQKMMQRFEDDENPVDAVIVLDTDRLARETLDYLTIRALIRKRGGRLISVSQPMIDDSPEGRMVDTILAGVNMFQSQITGRKTSKTLGEKAKIGWFPGKPPLGYTNIDNSHPSSALDKRIIGVDEEVAPFITQAFELYSSGTHSVKSIANYLMSKGVKPPLGAKINPSLVNQMLRNEFYLGKFYWQGKIWEGKHKPLVTREVFDLVQDVLSLHNQYATRKRKHSFLLRGFVYSNTTGNRLWAEPQKKGAYNFYYDPKNRKGSYVDSETLEKQVEEAFKGIKLREDYVNKVVEDAKTTLAEYRSSEETEKRQITMELTTVSAAMKEVEDARFKFKTMDNEAFERVYSRFETQLSELNDRYGKITKDYSTKVKSLEKILRLAENIGQAYEDADPELKKQYLKLFFKRLYVEDGKIVSYDLSDVVKTPVEEGSVRVNVNWLPRVDSNHQPTG